MDEDEPRGNRDQEQVVAKSSRFNDSIGSEADARYLRERVRVL